MHTAPGSPNAFTTHGPQVGRSSAKAGGSDGSFFFFPELVLKKFQQLVSVTPGGILSIKQLQEFVSSSFSDPGQEFEQWEPQDWTSRYKMESNRGPSKSLREFF